MRNLAWGVGLFALVAACANQPAGAPATGGTSASTPSAAGGTAIPALPDVVAKIDGVDVTRAEFEAISKAGDIDAIVKLTQAREQALDQYIVEKLVKAEAAKRGLSEDDLFKAEVDAKITPPSEEAILAFYEQNKERMPPGSTFESMRQQVVAAMTKGERNKAIRAFLDGLKAAAKVETFLPAFKIDVPARSGAPVKGPANAKIKIVEFSDFQCPYCTKAADTVKQIVETYPNDVSVEYRHFPLSFHDKAQRAAEASECANEQGKFWEYHDLLFANQSALDEANLTTYAGQVAGLDAAKFAACMAAPKAKEAVAADLKIGASVGMSGTPGFYINGEMLAGALPFEEFKKRIDAALAAK
ncbi:MAG: hypothetical protein RLZZ383_899 [Pseudomonadota bacterium]|jgi:protein-disulfide isomerase